MTYWLQCSLLCYGSGGIHRTFSQATPFELILAKLETEIQQSRIEIKILFENCILYLTETAEKKNCSFEETSGAILQ